MRMILSILRRMAMTSELVRKTLCGVAVLCALGSMCGEAQAQAKVACDADGTRVTGRRWDAVLTQGV